jgi:hypothetical protein
VPGANDVGVEGRESDVAVAAGELAEAARRWREAYQAWESAVRRQEALVSRYEAMVLAATGGLGLVRWRAACRRRRALTVADAKLRARALRARPAVEVAVAERGKALAGQEVAVAAAREALRRASVELVLFGLLGATAGGTELVELRRLARRPASR